MMNLRILLDVRREYTLFFRMCLLCYSVKEIYSFFYFIPHKSWRNLTLIPLSIETNHSLFIIIQNYESLIPSVKMKYTWII